MLKGGVWPFVRQKPYDIIANPFDMPKAIFISAFNSAPLTSDVNFALAGMDELFQKGLDYIVKLTDGKTHLNIDGKIKPFKTFKTKSEDGTVFVSTVKELEAGVDISVLREDGMMIPLPVGSYKKETGVSFRVEVEGVVSEVIKLETEDDVVEEEIVEVILDPSRVFKKAEGVELNQFTGPHPSGNVGVHIHHIDPINKGESVWYLKPQDVIAIARLFVEGKYDVSRVIALTGPQILKPRYYKAIAGMSVTNLLIDNIRAGENRVISGDVLTGQHIDTDGTLGFYHTSVTVIEEGKEQEFLGWMMPGFDKFSNSRTFPSWIMPNRKYALNANIHGEERAYVMTGEYEKVLPMDIYPTQLIKACMIEDIELMENLGIYEVSPEDLALCEFVCTSKIEVQSIIRHGLDLIRKENS